MLKRHSLSTWDLKWEYGFQTMKFSALSSAILENTVNGKSKNIPINNWGRNARFLFTNKCLPDFLMIEITTTEYK